MMRVGVCQVWFFFLFWLGLSSVGLLNLHTAVRVRVRVEARVSVRFRVRFRVRVRGRGRWRVV